MKIKYYSFVYIYLLAGIFVPFQVIMVPLVKYLSKMNMTNIQGLIVMHITLASSQGVFLLVNYIRTIPRDMEEAAAIDGCTTFKVYYKIVVPLMKPMLATICIMNALWVWNDFQMPLLILNQSPVMWTLPLFQFNFKSQYTYDYNMAFASYLIAMIPVMIVYAGAQKHIVSGLTQGAVKS
jgi:raffinose/stachyose/melibiose transport system permease protein